jgi:probable HAF family extracellular repeat protein
MQDLGALSTAFGSGGRAFGINTSGQVVGDWDGPGGGPFIWDGINGMQRIVSEEELQQFGFSFHPRGINSLGSVVGFGETAAGESRAIYWQQGLGLKLLDDLVALDANWEIQAAVDINEMGQIVGTAFNTLDGRFRGILLTPIPEPSALIFLCFGSLTLWALRYRTVNTTCEVTNASK